MHQVYDILSQYTLRVHHACVYYIEYYYNKIMLSLTILIMYTQNSERVSPSLMGSLQLFQAFKQKSKANKSRTYKYIYRKAKLN